MFSTPRKLLRFLTVALIILNTVIYTLMHPHTVITDYIHFFMVVAWLFAIITSLSFLVTWMFGGLTLDEWWP